MQDICGLPWSPIKYCRVTATPLRHLILSSMVGAGLRNFASTCTPITVQPAGTDFSYKWHSLYMRHLVQSTDEISTSNWLAAYWRNFVSTFLFFRRNSQSIPGSWRLSFPTSKYTLVTLPLLNCFKQQSSDSWALVRNIWWHAIV
jgi:hypothetical protein